MTTTLLLYSFIYLAALVCLFGCAVQAIRYARLPLHLRWELYPVPHEEASRLKHGGSYLEETDWWKKPRPFNLVGELKSMLPEMLFQKALREFNRPMWLRSFPFHFGLYLLIGSTGLLAGTAVISLSSPQLVSGLIGTILHFAYTAGGLAGAVLAVAGAVALLIRRLTDKELKIYTTPGDIFNLVFFIVTFSCLFTGYLLRPQGAPKAVELVQGLVTFNTRLAFPLPLAVGLVLGALLAAYIPLTHMSHFIGKFFTYHFVRWDDAPSLRGSSLEKKIAEYLTYRPRWAAPHVGANGARTWADIAMTNPAQGGRK
ncbi:MAG: respiratory nitrate reductase subunit gamma [Acidobacteriia bacterium]|nr:respiratory nitrate reductase subunit gamma [Terriglobia bacterium]